MFGLRNVRTCLRVSVGMLAAAGPHESPATRFADSFGALITRCEVRSPVNIEDMVPFAARSGVLIAFAATFMLTSCGDAYNAAETAQWLRVAGHFDETPEQINCIDRAMHDLLSEDELAD